MPSKVVFYGPQDIRIEAAGPVPAPGAGEVLVRVEACAICGSDVKTFRLGNSSSNFGGLPAALRVRGYCI